MITGKKKIWWNYNYAPALDAEGEIIGVSYNAINISDLKLKEQQSMAKDESLKAIAFIQSHEIRRPVSSIIGLMNLFKAQDYQSTREELMMLECAVLELDDKIRLIVNYTEKE
jgi:light-regulated signal transduction histidine kinase (bacteriophytochrome)